MLGPGRYLLGVAEIALLVGFAWLGAASIRRRLIAGLDGLPAHLATAVIALALLLWTAELLGSFGLFKPVPYLAVVIGVGLGVRRVVGGGWGCPSGLLGFSPGEDVAGRGGMQGEKEDAAAPEGHPQPPSPAILVALLIAAVTVVHFAVGAKVRLSTGMTGFDSTWYHGPFAAGFYQSGDTWSLHFIAPQFLAWFYPANSEVAHAVGMLAFGRDILSPLLNLGWFVGCLVAAWCIGRPYRVAPWSMALAAVALSVPALHDQAGEARNDIVGTFFLLAAVALALAQRERGPYLASRTAFALGPVAMVGLSVGLAAGTKLNFLLPAAVLVVGMALIAPRGVRWRNLGVAGLAALLGGGYWYLRNLAHTGNPLPWVEHLGSIDLPAPDQALGGREGHAVLGYLTDGGVWSDWFLPGLHDGLTILWPILLVLALAGLFLGVAPLLRCALPPHSGGKAHRSVDYALAVAGLTGLAAVVAWLVAPTSASGPDGIPRGFESGLRYLAPALVLGLAVLPPALLPTGLGGRFREAGAGHLPNGRILKAPSQLARRLSGWEVPRARLAIAIVLAAIAIGYPVQRHYLEDRYADPAFAAPGLNAAFAWAQGVTDARIATTGTRQYPLYGRDLSNRVTYIGEPRPHGGFTVPTTCRAWRRLLNAGDYDYAVTTRDRLEPGKPPYPPTARWTADPMATVILRQPPTVIYKLGKRLDPAACRE